MVFQFGTFLLVFRFDFFRRSSYFHVKLVSLFCFFQKINFPGIPGFTRMLKNSRNIKIWNFFFLDTVRYYPYLALCKIPSKSRHGKWRKIKKIVFNKFMRKWKKLELIHPMHKHTKSTSNRQFKLHAFIEGAFIHHCM